MTEMDVILFMHLLCWLSFVGNGLHAYKFYLSLLSVDLSAQHIGQVLINNCSANVLPHD